MQSREKLVKEIMRIIDESPDPWRKTAFYSDPEVQQLLDALYDRWNNSGGAGIPLDYATDEEVKFLYKKAVNLRPEDSESTLKKFFRKALLPGKKHKK